MNLNKITDTYDDFQYALITDSSKEENDIYKKFCKDKSVFTVDFSEDGGGGWFDLLFSDEDGGSFHKPILSLDVSEFSRQYRFWDENESIRNWESQTNDLFHLNLMLIASLHIFLSLDVDEIFIHISTFKHLESQFEEQLIYKFFSVFGKEVDVRLTIVDEAKSDNIYGINSIHSYGEILNMLELNTKNESSLTFFDRKKESDWVFENVHIPYDFQNIESCAIVGNSYNILKKDYGRLIDNHDVVVRMNRAPVKNYEDKIGKRTDFRVVNNVLAKGDELNESKDSNWINEVSSERLIFNIQKASFRIDVTKKTVNGNEIYFISEDLDNEIQHFQTEFGISKNLDLSTGMNAILTFNFFCRSISLFGFGFYEDDSFLHYWEETDLGFPKNITHDWEREKSIIEDFSSKEDFIIYD